MCVACRGEDIVAALCCGVGILALEEISMGFVWVSCGLYLESWLAGGGNVEEGKGTVRFVYSTVQPGC